MSKNTFNFRKAPEIEKLTLLLPSFWVLVLKYYFEYTKYVLSMYSRHDDFSFWSHHQH